MATQDDYTAIAIGLGAVVLLSKWGIENFPQIPNPFSTVKDKVVDPVIGAGKSVVRTGDQLTGGIQGDPRTPEYWTEYDLPYTDDSRPLINLKEEDESWLDYTTTFDLPGLPKYNVQDAPGQIGRAFRRIF